MPSSGYMAPEYLYRGEISAQSDIYSLGVIMMEITTREQNSSGNDQPSARKFIEKVRRNIIQLFVKLKFKIILHLVCTLSPVIVIPIVHVGTKHLG